MGLTGLILGGVQGAAERRAERPLTPALSQHRGAQPSPIDPRERGEGRPVANGPARPAQRNPLTLSNGSYSRKHLSGNSGKVPKTLTQCRTIALQYTEGG